MKQKSNNIHDELFQKYMTRRTEYGDTISSYHFFLEQQFNKNKTILDIGCGTGSFLDLIKAAGFANIYGVDISERAVRYGRQKYPDIADRLIVADGGWLPFKSHSIDIITSFDTLEHVPDVNEHVAEIFRILKNEGGIYILQTPNKYVNIPWSIIQCKNLMKWKQFHCSLQTYSSLKSLLSRNGFKDIVFFKRNILSEYNCKKVKKQFGKSGMVILNILNLMPKRFASNFWVIART